MSVRKLGEYAEVSSGRSFRGAIKSAENPSHRVIQTGDIEFANGKAFVDFESLVEVNLETNRRVECLADGDLLMVAKGKDKQLILLENVPENVICTQHFLLIKPSNKHEQITTQFLKAYISAPSSKRWIEGNSGGNYQSTLSITTLQALPIPDIEKNELFIEYLIAVDEELKSYQNAISARKEQLDHATDKLLKESKNA